MSGFDYEVLIKYFSGQASPEEALYVEDWRKESNSNAHFFVELFQSWNDETPFQKPDIEQRWNQFIQNQNRITQPQKTKKYTWIRYAAVVLIGIGMGIYFFQQKQQLNIQYTAAKDSTTYYLPDSTFIILNQQSQLQFKTEHSARHLAFSGTGFFEIHHNTSPLTITLASGLIIEDIGTAFWVEELDKTVTITVLDGRIRATYQTQKQEAGKNEILVFDLINKTFTISPRTGNFNFKDIELSEVCKQLSEYFNTPILLDTNLPTETLSLNGKALTFESCIDIITSTLELKKEVAQNGQIKLYK